MQPRQAASQVQGVPFGTEADKAESCSIYRCWQQYRQQCEYQREYQREYYVRAVVQALVDDIREHVVARCARDAVPAGQVPPPSTVCFGGAVRATRPKRSSKAPKKYAS